MEVKIDMTDVEVAAARSGVITEAVVDKIRDVVDIREVGWYLVDTSGKGGLRRRPRWWDGRYWKYDPNGNYSNVYRVELAERLYLAEEI